MGPLTGRATRLVPVIEKPANKLNTLHSIHIYSNTMQYFKTQNVQCGDANGCILIQQKVNNEE